MKKFFYLFFLLFLISCNNDIDNWKPDVGFEPQLALGGYIEFVKDGYGIIEVNVGITQPTINSYEKKRIGDSLVGYYEYEFLDPEDFDNHILLYEDSTLIDTIFHNEYYYDNPTIYQLYSDHIYPGKEYTIVVNSKRFGKVWASTVVPKRFKIKSIDSVEIYNSDSHYSVSFLVNYETPDFDYVLEVWADEELNLSEKNNHTNAFVNDFNNKDEYGFAIIKEFNNNFKLIKGRSGEPISREWQCFSFDTSEIANDTIFSFSSNRRFNLCPDWANYVISRSKNIVATEYNGEPCNVYNNVHNGYGLFVSYCAQEFELTLKTLMEIYNQQHKAE